MATQPLNPAPRPSRQGAFTLTELLITLAIMAGLLLVGVGTYWRMTRGLALRAAVSDVEAAMRGARAFAVHERSPVVIVLEPEPQEAFDLIQRLQARGKRTVGCWHFEQDQIDGSTLHGALGQTGAIDGVASSVPGKIGRALSFDGTSTAISVTSSYLHEIRDGVFVEACVRPDPDGLATGAVLPIVSKAGDGGNPFSLALNYQRTASQDLFRLEGSVRTEAGAYSARTDALVRAGEWTQVALSYVHDALDEAGDPAGVVLRINGQEVELFDATAGAGELVRNTAPMLIGKEGGAHFKGHLDELKIGSLVQGELYSLPRNTQVRVDPGSSDGHIHFDDEGKLDTRYHSQLVVFNVRSPEDRLTRMVQVNWLGGLSVSERVRVIK
ncbi:MAG: LamG-like jellyroll fold domain-containing protein [Planctomycetota bacterium]